MEMISRELRAGLPLELLCAEESLRDKIVKLHCLIYLLTSSVARIGACRLRDLLTHSRMSPLRRLCDISATTQGLNSLNVASLSADIN